MVSKNKHSVAFVPDNLKGWVANRLVSAHFRSATPLIWGHLFNVFVVAAAFWGHVSSVGLGLWAGAMMLVCARRYWVVQRYHRQHDEGVAEKAIRLLEFNTVSLATLTGFASFWLMQGESISSDRGILVAVMGTTLISAAGFTIRTLPRAAIAYILINACGLILALVTKGTHAALAAAVLVGASAALLTRMALTAYNLFVVRILREREAAASSDTVRMLLNDFEDHGSDWLFELDRNGDLVNVSTRFAEAAGRKAEDLNGRPFAILFKQGREREQLIESLDQRRHFRGLVLQLDGLSASDPKWWSINGRPASGGAVSRVHFRGVISDVSVEKHAEARVRHMAHYDSLTGLPNRMMFTQALHRMVAERAKKSRLAVLLIDFDKFKSINDMYGHPTGDAFLNEAGARLSQVLASSQLGGEERLLARLGGDEFAILMAGEDALDHSIRLGDALVAAMAQSFNVKDHIIETGISVGIAVTPDHADCADILLSNADIALYVAKEEGRGRWEMFAPGMDEAIHKRHSIARDLRHAVGNGELRLFLQPLVNVESGNKSGFEALLRWQHPEKGMIMPNDFIPVAEETGLIVPMGEWVIRTALAQAASWDEPYSISINLSPIQLRSPNLIPTVMRALADTGIDAGRVEFEITESVLMHDCEANIQVLNRLHVLGLKIALDDFGTGYASLNYLLTFPFDKIKIDRSFVNELETREDCRAIVGAVVGLANRLGMCTLAEGVEQEAQLVKLREQGCEMVQGWLFGKAMPAEHYGLGAKVETEEAETVQPAEASAVPAIRRKAA